MDALLLQMLSVLVGAAIVYVFGIRNLSVQRRNAFIEKQLSEFYQFVEIRLFAPICALI